MRHHGRWGLDLMEELGAKVGSQERLGGVGGVGGFRFGKKRRGEVEGDDVCIRFFFSRPKSIRGCHAKLNSAKMADHTPTELSSSRLVPGIRTVVVPMCGFHTLSNFSTLVQSVKHFREMRRWYHIFTRCSSP